MNGPKRSTEVTAECRAVLEETEDMLKKLVVVALMMLGAACGDDSASAGSGGSAGQGGSGEGGAPPDPYAALYACEETEFVAFKTLSGPGYDEETGFVGQPRESYVLHATQIYVRPEQEQTFLQVSGAVIGQLGTTPGLVAFSVGSDDGCGVARTIGVWESEEALYAFVGSGAHAEAMAQTAALSFTGRTTHWDATAEEVLSYDGDVARAKLADVEPLGY